MNTRIIACDACEGTGNRFVHRPVFDDPYYMHQTGDPCPACDGNGFIEVAAEPIEMEDLP
jgi:DnaJ-class molecular chaperone